MKEKCKNQQKKKINKRNKLTIPSLFLMYSFQVAIIKISHFKQVSAYEVCNRTRTPLHTSKTLEMFKKSTPCLIQKASRCEADRTSKKTVFYLSLSINPKILRENHVCLFFISLVQWWKFYVLFSLYKGRQTSK